MAAATPCWPAPVSAMTRDLPILTVRRAWPRALLILWAPVWRRSSRLRKIRAPPRLSESRLAYVSGVGRPAYVFRRPSSSRRNAGSRRASLYARESSSSGAMSVSGTNRPPNAPKRPCASASGGRKSVPVASGTSHLPHERRDLRRVLDSRRRLHSRRHVHDVGPHPSHGVRDVLGLQPAREHQRARAIDTRQESSSRTSFRCLRPLPATDVSKWRASPAAFFAADRSSRPTRMVFQKARSEEKDFLEGERGGWGI